MDEITLTHQELAARRTAHRTTFYIEVDEEQAHDIAAGYVPESVRAQVRAMCDWREDDERRAIANDARDARKRAKKVNA